MISLLKDNLNDPKWKKMGIKLPEYDVDLAINKAKLSPRWIHIAPSNLYRAMIAPIQQKLIESGYADYGMIAIETHDIQVIEDIYRPHDNLSIRVVMPPDGKNELMIVSSVADAIFADNAISPTGWAKALDYFSADSLQMVSVTCTEKGYEIGNLDSDIADGLTSPKHLMAKIAAFAYHRYKNNGKPIAFVSMDNCAENGLKFFRAVMHFAIGWNSLGFVDDGFIRYLEEEVTFPWTMIDRITPRPALNIKEMLENMGIEGMNIIATQKGTVIAPFVNTEHVSYLVIEDKFPSGRPPLERAGVLFCDTSEKVELYERMKVGACLNPNQTTLAIFGCLFNYQSISDAIADPMLKNLLYRQSYDEALPIIKHPGKIEPEDFLREVLEERLPNPNIPDTPARIITDTSAKVAVRYGENIIAHGNNAKNLKYIPLSIAGWCRYLMGVDDFGNEMSYNPSAQPPFNKWSPDPRLKELTDHVAGIRLGSPKTVGDKLKKILLDKGIFGVNLYEVGLAERVEGYFREMIAGVGAVRATLGNYLV